MAEQTQALSSREALTTRSLFGAACGILSTLCLVNALASSQHQDRPLEMFCMTIGLCASIVGMAPPFKFIPYARFAENTRADKIKDAFMNYGVSVGITLGTSALAAIAFLPR